MESKNACSYLIVILPFFWFIAIASQLSLEVLDLHNRFECGGDWGMERTFNAWVEKQSWRKLMPVQYFQFHVSKSALQFLLSWHMITGKFLAPGLKYLRLLWLACVIFFCEHLQLKLSLDILTGNLHAAKVREKYARRIGAPLPVQQYVLLPHDIAASMYDFEGGEHFFKTWVGVPGDSCMQVASKQCQTNRQCYFFLVVASGSGTTNFLEKQSGLSRNMFGFEFGHGDPLPGIWRWC
jgi:hypothetical protein